jgi:hypothetical protein
VVQSLAEVAPVDGVVIAEAREPQASYEELTPLLPEERIFAPALLRVTRDRGALILAARRAERQS